ncbi:tetratricopeptide repeat protein [Chitinophaga flava]|uniref:Tetratricopeptide repeat protein n=1 Tax=Chitinophaga flava TaxID=2259036 RepID=A0A365XTA4_9BACT|nr:hypothetical protein [Chitinophaga flava]RBL89370.1 hypothetical protein DF182_22885 [Chitinophaga flava]
MSELDYIDDYFTGVLSSEERQVFEQRCAAEQTFAREVAFYLSSRTLLKQQLREQKQQQFKAITPARPKMRRLPAYLTAAAILAGILLASWWLFIKPPSTQQLSATYINKHLLQLSVTMQGSPDSLQMGITAYNNKAYDHAEKIFLSLSTQEASAPDAVKYLGLLYLVTRKYDSAIVQFDRLIQYPIYANPGPFYKALALLQRARPGDQQQAGSLLEKVRDNQLPGNQQAIEWLKHI